MILSKRKRGWSLLIRKKRIEEFSAAQSEACLLKTLFTPAVKVLQLTNFSNGKIGFWLLQTICSGVIDKKLNGSEIIAVPLEAEGDVRIGQFLSGGIEEIHLSLIHI